LPLSPLEIVAGREGDLAIVSQEVVVRFDQDECGGMIGRRYDGKTKISVETSFVVSRRLKRSSIIGNRRPEPKGRH
jgi:hypothetical protein